MVDPGLGRSVPIIAISVLAARRYEGSCHRVADLKFTVEAPIPDEMDTSAIQAFSKNGSSGRWMITRGRIVAVTLAGLYFAGRGRVVAVICRDPILVQIVLQESSPAIEGIKLPFPERGLELLSDCVGLELTWKAQYLRPYASMISDQDCGIDGPPIPTLDDEKPIEEFLTLKERIEVALLVSDNAECGCARLGIIEECSPRGVWCGFLVPHNFYVVVNISMVNSECNHHTAYCKEESITTLGAAINRRVLWSGYKVRPTEPLGPPLGSDVKDEGIGGPPIPIQARKVKIESSGSDMKANDGRESEINGHTIGSEEKVDNGDTDSPSANPDRPLWRGRICYLLNDDLSILGKAKIVVCLPDEPFDEENLGDTDAGVLFLSERDLQMTTFRWPLAQVRLEGGRLLSEIVTWCSEHEESSGDDLGLERARKNPYRHLKRQKLSPPIETKLKRKLSDSDIQRVSSLRCYKFRCCQSFSWDDTLALRRKFYGSTFKLRREIAYAVQGQLTHYLSEERSS